MQKFNLPRGKAATIAKLFDYRGKKIRLVPVTKIQFWHLEPGPTHNEYRALNLSLAQTSLAPANGEGYTLTPGTVIACRSTYEGSDIGITIYAHPNDQTKLTEADNGTR